MVYRSRTGEKEGSPLTCSAIIKATIEQDIEEEDRRVVWVQDAQSALSRGCVEAARTILAYTLQTYPDRAAIWTLAAELEKHHGSRDNLQHVLERAVTACPRQKISGLCIPRSRSMPTTLLVQEVSLLGRSMPILEARKFRWQPLHSSLPPVRPLQLETTRAGAGRSQYTSCMA